MIENATEYNWLLTVADSDIQIAQAKIANASGANVVSLNANNINEVEYLVSKHDVVISLLPPTMHVTIAKTCIKFKKHLVTASYVSSEMQALNEDAKNAGVLLLNECGLDPGIDHLSAMKLINTIKQQGGEIAVFKSFCGGLVAPDFDDNPWNYKFTWNPRNVVLAGQATAKYLFQNELKFIPASRIFTDTEPVHVAGYGDFESYANRDSLGYITPYGIEKAHTVLRGTLRKKGFAEAWNMLVKIGLTDDTHVIVDANKLSYKKLLSAFLPGSDVQQLAHRVCQFLQIKNNSELYKKLEWLGLFSNDLITLNNATPAAILQDLLLQKFKLKQGELDMIVMQHYIEATVENKTKIYTSSLVVKGETDVLTAMAKTVGLPLAIAAKLILTNKVNEKGVQIPITSNWYEPILTELESYHIKFAETIS